MSTRLVGIVATLWFFFALLSLFIALALSPLGLRLLLPAANPASWVYPSLLVFPPVVLLTQRLLGATLSKMALRFLALTLGSMTLLMFVFVRSLILGR